ncbi:acyltransferase domain-containing protein [Desertihabitans aurantiacus]|uniref:acyltransferase domain-containing protein n=1 Tax=Desertihabitans aurantiacus TaxID=2282477 RepID=UPI000DF77462|nr:acyltransferase domain-containing protein [Desertihabitans aurantiacus]
MRVSTDHLQDRLAGWTAPRLAELLGLRPDDAADTAALVEQVLSDPAARDVVAEHAEALAGVVGDFTESRGSVFGDDPARLDVTRPDGTTVQAGLALVALLAATGEVRAFHQRHGIGEEQTWRTLSDLGQQVWVHRRTFGGFGLHTQEWLTWAWSGALHWLGRLQFNLRQRTDEAGTVQPGRWVLSVHIPESGPLGPDVVDDSFARARDFFARHHPDHPAEELHCSSWLLDPALAEGLPGSNMATFQQRWTPTGRSWPGDGDALFFTFRRRGDVDLDSLPQQTSLQRLVVQRIRDGRGWRSVEGHTDLPDPGLPEPTPEA